jgi:hypothetical protein
MTSRDGWFARGRRAMLRVMTSSARGTRLEASASPTRNFSLSLQDRLRALAGGPRAYMRRRRRIEDLQNEIVRDIAASPTFDCERPPHLLLKKVETLNDLIERHNKYFPIEANLPFDPVTGVMLELGRPWKPMQRIDLDTLIGLARDLK